MNLWDPNQGIVPNWANGTPIGMAGDTMQDANGNWFKMGQSFGGGDNFTPGVWEPIGTAMGTGSYQTSGQGDQFTSQWVPDNQAGLQAHQEAVAAGPENAYDFSRYNRDVTGLPTLESNAFDNWQGNDFLNRMVTNADKGAIYQGLSALLGGTQDLGAATGVSGAFDSGASLSGKMSDATYRKLAQYMGINTASPDWKQQVLEGSNNFAMVKGMIGSENDPRASSQILYQKGENGWNPILNYDWHEREKGSWWDEGGSMIMVPLSIVAGGLAAGGGIGGAASGGITGTGGATGTAAYGSGALGSTLGTAGTGSLGAGLSGAAGTGSTLAAAGGAAGGLGGTLANAIGMGSEYASLPGYAQNAISGALQGAGQSALSGNNPLEGALTGGLMGGINPAIKDAVGGMGLGNIAGGALTGAASGGLNSLLQGGNPLTGALMGGIGGGTSGTLRDLGAGSGAANMIGQQASRLSNSYLQNQIRDEVLQGRQDVLNNLYSEAQRRGISRQQLEAFMQTPQGRAAAQALLAQQGKGTLQSLFG